MKKTLFVVSIFAALVMSGCRPETRNEILGIPEGAILLSTENFTDPYTKTSVDGVYVVWDGDETIDFYVGSDGSKQSRDVVVSGDDAYITVALTGTDSIRGYYPSGLATANQTTNGPRVATPTEYSSSFSGGRQVLALPMVGLAESGATSIRFKHLTAALDIKMKNSLTETDLYVDSVVVVAGSHYLNLARVGKNINLTKDDLGMSATTAGATDADKRVKVSFSSAVKVVDGTSIQVPILPIGSIDNITINVYCHSATTNYKYSHTESSPAIARNEMLTARVDLNTSGYMQPVVISHEVDLNEKTGDFTASDGDILKGTPRYGGTVCTIPAGATVTLKNVDASSKALYLRAAGTATIIISGKNTINASGDNSVIHVASGYTITIDGDITDTLVARSASTKNAAAIGAYKSNACGNIIIEGGTIIATSSYYGAAIGSCQAASCGNITITGGKVIAENTGTASYAAGAGIGVGNSGACGDIEISGGTVVATGGYQSAGIGTSGSSGTGTCGDITITSGSVTATKGTNAQHSIGNGYNADKCGTVTIGGNTGYITTSPYTYPTSK